MTIPIPESVLNEAGLSVDSLRKVIVNEGGKYGLPERFRALFTLRGIDTDEAVQAIGQAFTDPSALLKHELAYVLGQMQRPAAVPILTAVLCNESEESIVRHEAAEALGAIGLKESVSILQKYLNDPSQAVRETCEIAIKLIEESNSDKSGNNSDTQQGGADFSFGSVDPAPALSVRLSVADLQTQLMDTSLDLYNRYKAMFSLRNRGTEEAVLALCTGFADQSALFRHEIAYVLGQLQHPASVPALAAQLRIIDEAPMVRHECAEALGSIATEECLSLLEEFEGDAEIVVRESCTVARDMYDFENNPQNVQFYPVN